MLLSLILATRADTITLDTGATLQGELSQYEAGGDCQIKITEGELRQVIVIVPCYRVQSFVRTAQHSPVAISHIPAATPAVPPPPPSGPQIPSFVTAETDPDPAWPAPTPKLSATPETPFMPIAEPIAAPPPEEVPIEGGPTPQETWHPVHF